MNGQYLTGQHLDRFWHGVCTMVPLGAWVPWAEVVQIASGHGFTEDMCFHCADHWQMLDGLEFDPGQATDPTEVIRIRFLYHRDIHGEQGLVCVSSDEENVDNGKCEVEVARTASASTMTPRRWKAGVLDPAEGVEVTLPLPQPLDKDDVSLMLVFWHLYSQHQLDQRCRSYNLAPDIPPWAFTLFASPGFTWTTARVKAFQQSLLHDLEAQEDPVQNVAPQIRKTKWGRCNLPNCTQRAFRPMMGSRGPFLVCSRQKCHGKRDLTPQEWTRLPRTWQELWPVEWCKIPFHRRPLRPVSCLKRPRRRCPRSRNLTCLFWGVSDFSFNSTFISPCFLILDLFFAGKKPPKRGTVRARPAAKKAPHQKPKKGHLQLCSRRSLQKKPAARVYTPEHQRTGANRTARETRTVASKAEFSMQDLLTMSETKLVLKLLDMGFLCYRKVCPFCSSQLSKPDHKHRRQRCLNKACHNWVTLWTRHPIFVLRGTAKSVQTQAAVL